MDLETGSLPQYMGGLIATWQTESCCTINKNPETEIGVQPECQESKPLALTSMSV